MAEKITVYMTVFPETERSGKRSAEFRAGRALLAHGLRELYGLRTETDDLPELLETDENGKPFLKDHPEIAFNITHSGRRAACVFADAPVGVDLEKLAPVRASLVRRVLHPDEQRVLEQYAREKQIPTEKAEDEGYIRLFFRYWTLKESYLKMQGTGLRTEPGGICFRIDPEDLSRAVCAQDPDVFCFQQMIGGDYVLSFCARLPVSGPDDKMIADVPEVRIRVLEGKEQE